MARAFEVYHNLPRLTVDAGLCHALGGRIAEGRALVEEGLGIADALRLMSNPSFYLAALGEVYLMADDRDRAWQTGERALTHARRHGERGGEVVALRLLAEAAARGNTRQAATAAALLREALTLAKVLEMHPLTARCHADLATRQGRANDHGDAAEHATTAMAMYRGMGMHFWLAKLERELHRATPHSTRALTASARHRRK